MGQKSGIDFDKFMFNLFLVLSIIFGFTSAVNLISGNLTIPTVVLLLIFIFTTRHFSKKRQALKQEASK